MNVRGQKRVLPEMSETKKGGAIGGGGGQTRGLPALAGGRGVEVILPELKGLRKGGISGRQLIGPCSRATGAGGSRAPRAESFTRNRRLTRIFTFKEAGEKKGVPNVAERATWRFRRSLAKMEKKRSS